MLRHLRCRPSGGVRLSSAICNSTGGQEIKNNE